MRTNLTIDTNERSSCRKRASDASYFADTVEAWSSDGELRSDGWAETSPDGKSITLCITLPMPIALCLRGFLHAMGWGLPWGNKMRQLLDTEVNAAVAREQEAHGPLTGETPEPNVTHPVSRLSQLVNMAMLNGVSKGRRSWERHRWVSWPACYDFRRYDRS